MAKTALKKTNKQKTNTGGAVAFVRTHVALTCMVFLMLAACIILPVYLVNANAGGGTPVSDKPAGTEAPKVEYADPASFFGVMAVGVLFIAGGFGFILFTRTMLVPLPYILMAMGWLLVGVAGVVAQNQKYENINPGSIGTLNGTAWAFFVLSLAATAWTSIIQHNYDREDKSRAAKSVGLLAVSRFLPSPFSEMFASMGAYETYKLNTKQRRPKGWWEFLTGRKWSLEERAEDEKRGQPLAIDVVSAEYSEQRKKMLEYFEKGDANQENVVSLATRTLLLKYNDTLKRNPGVSRDALFVKALQEFRSDLKNTVNENGDKYKALLGANHDMYSVLIKGKISLVLNSMKEENAKGDFPLELKSRLGLLNEDAIKFHYAMIPVDDFINTWRTTWFPYWSAGEETIMKYFFAGILTRYRDELSKHPEKSPDIKKIIQSYWKETPFIIDSRMNKEAKTLSYRMLKVEGTADHFKKFAKDMKKFIDETINTSDDREEFYSAESFGKNDYNTGHFREIHKQLDGFKSLD